VFSPSLFALGLTEFGSVFEHLHKAELKRAKDDGVMTAAQLETIVHPNEYFKRSYLLRNMDKKTPKDVKMEG
jgi:DNA primase large subunit